MRTSVPQMEQRYCNFTLRISPEGGGGGTGCAKERKIFNPTRNAR